MTTGRLEAFSDGVIAIIITIMVLELKVPRGGDLAAVRPLVPVLAAYVVSFVYVGIYWNNHHHLLHAAERVDGGVLWANLHLLFWLSLVPVVTDWVGLNPAAPTPAAAYGVVLLMAGRGVQHPGRPAGPRGRPGVATGPGGRRAGREGHGLVGRVRGRRRAGVRPAVAGRPDVRRRRRPVARARPADRAATGRG